MRESKERGTIMNVRTSACFFLLLLFVLFSVSVWAVPLIQSRQAVLVSSSSLQQGQEFVVDLYAYPTLPGLAPESTRFNNYKAVIYYDGNALDHISSQNKVEGFNVDPEGKSSGYISLSAAQPFGAYFTNSPTLLASFTFVPKTSGTSEITLNSVEIVNSLGSGGGSAEVITQRLSMTATVQASSGACVPRCAGKKCGTDGCGGFCGMCSAGQQCTNGQCSCIPNCAGRECGNDGCGGSCGTCPAGNSCVEEATTSRCVVGQAVGQRGTSGTSISKEEPQRPTLSVTSPPEAGEVSIGIGISRNLYIILGVVLLVIGIIVGVYFLKKKPVEPQV